MTNNNVAVDDGFDKFLQLPGELQCYVLSFIPARFLVRDVARTCRQMKGTIDAYVQRRITTALSVSSSQQKTKQHHPLAAAFEDEPCTLMFEAQRPIDTLTSRHRLYYSHMEYAAVDEEGDEDDESERYVDHVSTLQAHFTFLHAHDVDMNASTLSNDSNAAQPNAHDAYDGPSSYVQGRRGRRRTNTRTGARPWATWSEPVTSSLAAIERGRRRLNDDGGGGGAAGSTDDLRSTSREASSRDASLARREAHYNVRGGTLGAGSSGGAASVRRPPTYRFQLDALDSFETWILSLTVQKLWWQTVSSPSPTMTTTSLDRWQPRPMRWEKRVVEGLDRIFRDWFKPATTAVTATSATSALAIPDERELELDGQGCILRIQPHLNEHAGTHPALVSMSSHYYLSNAAAAAATANTVTAVPSSATYVDFTFHCTGVRLNAGRLLSVIEDIDLHVDRTRKQMNESNKSSSNTTAAMAASDEATSAAVVQQQTRSASDLDGLASTGFIVMSGRTSSGVSWSQAR